MDYVLTLVILWAVVATAMCVLLYTKTPARNEKGQFVSKKPQAARAPIVQNVTPPIPASFPEVVETIPPMSKDWGTIQRNNLKQLEKEQ